MESIFKSIEKLRNGTSTIRKRLLCTSISLSLLLASMGMTSFAEIKDSDEDFYSSFNTPKGTSLSVSSDESDYNGENLLSNKDYILGGSYDDLCDRKNHFIIFHPEAMGKYQVHHLISKRALNDFFRYLREERQYEYEPWQLDFWYDQNQGWAPSIIMEKKDHERTRSYYVPENGSDSDNEEAKDFIDDQWSRLIDKGDFAGLLEDELEDIEQKFGRKYEQAIKQVREYIESLNFRKKGSAIIFNNPNHPKRYFFYRPAEESDYSQDDEPKTKRVA